MLVCVIAFCFAGVHLCGLWGNVVFLSGQLRPCMVPKTKDRGPMNLKQTPSAKPQLFFPKGGSSCV